MRKILIVDDSAVIRERLKQLLGGLKGVEVLPAGEARRGRELAGRLKPDVIIMDVQTRDGRGMEMIQDLKRSHPVPSIIVLTNEAYPEIRNRCLTAGADYFFDKSGDYRELGSVLSDIQLGASAR
ncbi:MAG: response regulator [Betaproteobacteria bacterium]